MMMMMMVMVMMMMMMMMIMMHMMHMMIPITSYKLLRSAIGGRHTVAPVFGIHTIRA